MAERTLSTELTMENIRLVQELLADFPEKLAALVDRLPPEALTQPLGPGERTITGVLAHLVNCEALTADSIYLALLKNTPQLHKLHAERDIGRLLRHDRFSFGELIGYFRFRRKVLLGVLEGLSEKQWARTIREEGKQRQESVYWRARGQALHELEHLEDIEAKLPGLA